MELQLLFAAEQQRRQRGGVPIVAIQLHPAAVQRQPDADVDLGGERELLTAELPDGRAVRLQRAGRVFRGAVVVHAAEPLAARLQDAHAAVRGAAHARRRRPAPQDRQRRRHERRRRPCVPVRLPRQRHSHEPHYRLHQPALVRQSVQHRLLQGLRHSGVHGCWRREVPRLDHRVRHGPQRLRRRHRPAVHAQCQSLV